MPAPQSARITAVVAMAENRVIGNGPDIPWKIPGEQRRFKELTMGGVLVMGRATFDSIGRPLPGRHTIVITRDRAWRHDGVEVAHDVDEALDAALATGRPVFVAGGGQIYAAALPRTDVIELTIVHAEPDGDAFFPELGDDWAELTRESHDTHSFVTLARPPRATV